MCSDGAVGVERRRLSRLGFIVREGTREAQLPALGDRTARSRSPDYDVPSQDKGAE